MEQIKNILNNQWVINIGTGLVVYIITTIISRIILNKATNKEKQKQMDNANKEVIRILKPYIVEKNFLNEEIIICIIKSVARKFDVSFREIYNVREICEELIREILESSYVDNEKKEEYIYYLNDIIEKNEQKVEIKENLEALLEKKYQITKNKTKLYNILSLYMSFIVMIISVLVTIFSESKYESFFSISEPMQISILIIITEISMMVSVLYLKMMKERKYHQRELEDKMFSSKTKQKVKYDSMD